MARNRRCLVASPAYIAREGIPTTLMELQDRECLLFLLDGQTHDVWHFGIENRINKVIVRSRFVANDTDVTRRWAIAGLGIAYKSRLDVAQDIERGLLVQILPEVLGEADPLNFICPHRDQLSPLVRQVYDHLKEDLIKHII